MINKQASANHGEQMLLPLVKSQTLGNTSIQVTLMIVLSADSFKKLLVKSGS